jgi:hypothetical protein
VSCGPYVNIRIDLREIWPQWLRGEIDVCSVWLETVNEGALDIRTRLESTQAGENLWTRHNSGVPVCAVTVSGITMTKKKHALEELVDELSLALGEAVWAFARIERTTYSYLKALSTDSLDVLMAGVMLRGRLQVMEHLIARANGKDSMRQLALKCVDRIDKLSNKRNLFVHNPWMTSIDLDRNTFVSEIEKITDDTKRMSLAELRQFTIDCTQLNEDLHNALSELNYNR